MQRPHRHRPARAAHARGLGVIAALVILVVLSSLAAAILRLNWGQQIGAAQDLDGTKASLAAGAGAEWGLFQALRGSWVNCTNSTQTLDLRSTTGFFVTVTCTSRATAYVEGGAADGVSARNVRVYRIDAVACNGTSSCPDNTRAATMTYVERQRRVTATSIDTHD